MAESKQRVDGLVVAVVLVALLLVALAVYVVGYSKRNFPVSRVLATGGTDRRPALQCDNETSLPVILPRPMIDHWLDPAVNDPDELKPMLLQFRDDEMQCWPVGKAVGNVRNQGPELMEPI